MEELENIALELSKISKKDCFSAPEGYFDTLLSNVQNKLEKKKKTSVYELFNVFFTPQKLVYSLVLASVLFVCIFGFYKIFYQKNSIAEEQVYFSDLYLLDESLLIDIISEAATAEEKGISDTYKDAVIAYLTEENNIDYLLYEY